MIDTKLAAAAIRKELKQAFPSAKFSVRKQDHSAVFVTYPSTVDRADLDKVIDKYQAQDYDAMADCWNYRKDSDLPRASYVIAQRAW